MNTKADLQSMHTYHRHLLLCYTCTIISLVVPLICLGVSYADAAPNTHPGATIIGQPEATTWLWQLEKHESTQPTTVTSTIEIGSEAEVRLTGAWLAGFSALPDSLPTTLALCWSPIASGWFGDRWGLQLVSADGLLLAESVPHQGSGFLQGSSYVAVMDAEPAWGHSYRTTLSYYPAGGAVALQVIDLTDSKTVYSGAVQVQPYAAPLYPSAGFALSTGDVSSNEQLSSAGQTIPATVLESLTASASFNPLNVDWGLIQPQKTGLLLTDELDRREDVTLRLTVPWRDLPGEWILSTVNDGRQSTLLRTQHHGQEAVFSLPKNAVANMPAGKVRLVLEHKDQEETTFSAETNATVGAVHVSVANVETHDARLTGVLRVVSDGNVETVNVRLKAQVAKVLFDRDDRGVLKSTSQPLQTIMAINQTCTPTTEPLDIPFALSLADAIPTDELYQDAQLVLEPEIHAQIEGLQMDTQSQTLHITLGRPSFIIDPNVRHQTVDGFGVSGAWWAQYLGGMSDPMRNQLADLLFSPESGIGLSQYRYNIGGGLDEDIPDPWRTAETFETSQGVYDWTRDANARWFLQAAKQRGVEEFILFAVSPSKRITRSGHTYNKNKLDANIDAAMYSQFAQYITDIWHHFRDVEDITFNTISPFNEPEWAWEGGNQEGTPLTLQQVLAISRTLATTLAEQNIPARLLIPEAGAWEFLYGKGRWYADMILADLVLAKNTILAIHSYWTTDTQRKLAGEHMKKHPNQSVWQTEWCEMMGGRDYGMGSALTLAHTVYADLTLANVSAWQHWVAVDYYNHRDSLLYTNYRTPGDPESPESLEETKKLWALGNFSRFVRPGSVRIDVRSNYTLGSEPYRSGILMSAFQHEPSGKLVVVAINQADTWQEVRLVLPTDMPQVTLTPYRTSETESLERLDAVTLTSAASSEVVGTVRLAPQSITTFVAGVQVQY